MNAPGRYDTGRLFERQADLFPIREKGGCYFSPVEHTAFVDRIDRLLQTLRGKLRRFPVPAGTPQGDRSVREAVAAGLATLIAEHEAAVESFGNDTGWPNRTTAHATQ
jgi:hypothetical protein